MIKKVAVFTKTKRTFATTKARSEEVNRQLTDLSRAMDKCRAMGAEHAACEQKIALLRADRRAMLADSVMSKGDPTALARSDRDLKTAEARLKDLASLAEDAKLAIAELEARYTAAQEPLIAMGKEIPRLQALLLEQAAQTLLPEYGEKVCQAYDVYIEILSIVLARNIHAHAAGIAVMPEDPLRLTFPGVPIGAWNLENSIAGATSEQFNQATDRAEKKLAALGIT